MEFSCRERHFQRGQPGEIGGWAEFPGGDPEQSMAGGPIGLTDFFCTGREDQLGLLLEIRRVRANNFGTREIGVSRLRAGTAQAVGRQDAT